MYALELESIHFGTKLAPSSKIQVIHIPMLCDHISKLQFLIGTFSLTL